MTQAKTPTRKPTTAKPAVKAAPKAEPVAEAASKAETVAAGAFEFPKFEIPGFEMPKFEMPNVDFSAATQAEIPAVFRDFAEKAMTQAKESFAKLKEAAEEATDAIEDTYETARAGLVELNEKSIDAVKANSDAAYGFAKSMLAVKTFAEAIELQSAFMRQQFEAISAQAKELQEVAGKVATDAAKPAKDAIAKTFETLKPGN
ncbi:phasin [Pinisolibacter sp.]|uniref:phasin n=1 Tax=Pinisolibacter sp. TaxID=2172024 RepID=UPI002FDCF0CB